MKLTGRRVGKRLEVASGRPGRDFEVLASAQETTSSDAGTTADGSGTFSTAATTTKNLAIVLINFKDNTSAPFAKSAVQSALTGSSTSIKAFFEEESKSRWSVTGTVFGWYTLDTPTTLRLDHVARLGAGTPPPRRAAACRASPTSSIVVPNTSSCGWAGLGYINGTAR